MVSLSSSFMRALARLLAPADITPIQFGILDILFKEEANTVTGVAQAISLDAATVSRQIDRMSERCLVRRLRSRRDRRSVRLRLTAEGRELISGLISHANENSHILLRGISEEELDAFVSTGWKLQQNLMDMGLVAEFASEKNEEEDEPR